MANEIQISYATGQTLRAALYDADTTSATVGYVWDGTEYVAVGSLVGTSWRITLTEIGSTGEYRGDLPAGLVGTPVRVKVMSGATPGIGDAEVAGGVIGAESGGGGSATVVPIGAVLTQFSVPKVDLELAQGEARTFQITFTGSTGNPTSFQGDTITCVVTTIRGTTALSEVSCTVLTTDYNVVSIPFTGSHTATAGTFRHTLWNKSDDQRLAYGAVPIARTVGYST